MAMTQEQILAAFNAITESTGTLRQALETQQTRSDQAMSAVARQLQEQSRSLTEAMRQNTEFLRQEATSRRREGMVETKAIQKPSQFSGKESDWAAWSYKLVTWLETQQTGAEFVLEWAASRGSDSIGQEVVDQEVAVTGDLEQHENAARELNRSLHAILTSLTVSGTTAFEMVKNTKKSLGLELWRKLSRKFDPRNPTTNLKLL